jgi:hypothetical protein
VRSAKAALGNNRPRTFGNFFSSASPSIRTMA